MMESNENKCGSKRDPKILIIGAGIAGIAAGNMLAKEGFRNFKILEAAERMGGRIWTVRTALAEDQRDVAAAAPQLTVDTGNAGRVEDRHPVAAAAPLLTPKKGTAQQSQSFVEKDEKGSKAEMGANWIHGVENNPIYTIADENHLLQLRHKDKSLRSKNVFVSENGTPVNDRMVREVDLLYGKLLMQCESFFTDNIPAPDDDDSVGAFLEHKFSEKIAHYGNGDRHLRELIFGHRKLLECCISGCDNLDEVALQDFGSYENLPGIHYTIPPGFDTILEILSKDIPEENIIFKAPVRCIHWDLGPESQYPACVEMENGDKHYADHVICTISLGVLKTASDRLFKPALPQEKLQAIAGLGYGTVDKVFLEFSQPVVEPDVFRINILWDDDAPHQPDIQHTWSRKIYSFEVVHENILVGWLSGKEALYMESLTEEQIGQDCAKILENILKKEVPPPIRVIRTKWGSDPLTQGSYSFIKVGSTVQDVEELGRPLKARGHVLPSLLFGGEATHPKFYSTTHGALLTGYREAGRLIKMYRPHTSEVDSGEESDDNDDNGIKISF